VMEEQQGGRVAGAEGTRGTEGGGGREGTGRTWALSLREVGAMVGCVQGREGPDSRVPPGGSYGRTGGGGLGTQVRREESTGV
jgi:hypothetical protein